MGNIHLKLSKLTSLILLIGLFLVGSNIYSKPIDRESAKKIASNRVNKMRKLHPSQDSPNDKKADITFEMEGIDQTFYVFNIGDNEGFIVVSGDDATEEILMSCDSGHFSIDEVPDNMISWLKCYSSQIQWLRRNGITREMNQRKAGSFDKYYRLEDDPSKAARLARWNQCWPVGKEKKDLYNFGFPVVSNDEGLTETAPTGCSITAIAQLLYYHQWPTTIGPDDIPSYTTKTNKIKMSGFNHGTAIDWSHIYRTYSNSQSYSDEERTAISTLMKMIGVALKADYKYKASSARLMNSPSILMKYFSYDEMEYVSKIDDEDAWLEMIYDELVTNGPVLYRGEDPTTEGASHSFLIEGIDGNEVWINFGWGETGSVKSQLSLCANQGYQFYDKQSAVFGARPNKLGKSFNLRLSTSSLLAMTNREYSRQSPEEDFPDIPLQLTYTNIFDDTTFDIGFLVENVESGEQKFYPLFTRTLSGFNSSTSNVMFTFGKGLSDGVYRIYGASRKYGTDEYHANYNKLSKYIEITIQNNKLYFGKVDNHNSTSLLQSTQASNCEYKLYSKVNYSDTRTNADGVVFYKTDLYLETTKNGVKTSYIVDEGTIYNTPSYSNQMYPCMLLDIENDRIYIFHNSKSEDPYYGMTGYIYSSPISSINFTREIIYDQYNCGWFPYFTGSYENGRPVLHHFSFAGYYEVLSLYEDGSWETYTISKMMPSDAEKDGYAHTRFLVIGDNKVKDQEATYSPSDSETVSYTLQSVDSETSGEYTIPETVDGKPVNSIASYAFSTCDNITSITIPETITSIEEYAFRASNNLTSIKVMSPTPIDLSYTFEQDEEGEGGLNDMHYVMSPFELVDKSNCILYVPRGSYEAYAFAVGWGDFKNIIEYDDVTSIDNIQSKETSTENYWYGISGVVYNDKPTVKGIYIHKGKKIIIE